MSDEMDKLCVVEGDLDRLYKAVTDACDLLTERTYGNAARSPGHNARLLLEGVLQSIPEIAPRWRCFHCDEIFSDRDAAMEHFGISEMEIPGCKLNAIEGGLLGIVRRQEDELQKFRCEETESCREFYRLGADHYQAVKSAEEKGYARGIKDAREEAARSLNRNPPQEGAGDQLTLMLRYYADSPYWDAANETVVVKAALLSTAAKEIDDLRAQVADLGDPEIKDMRLADGSFNMELGGEIVKRMAMIMTTWFRESGAKNYVEMSINATDAPFEKFLFYVQKRGDGAKTPTELRHDAEAEVARLTSYVEAFRREEARADKLGREMDDQRATLTFGALLDLAQEGLARWKDKEHNAKWWRRIDGTPIPNDLLVNVAEVIAEQFKTP